MNIVVVILFITLLLFNKKNDTEENWKSHCNKGSKLFYSYVVIRRTLLNIYNNDIDKIERFIYLYIKNITKNIDKHSISLLKLHRRMLIDSLKCNKFIKQESKSHIKNHKLFLQELPLYKKAYNLEYYSEEVFYYHHGLRFCNERILKYIYTKDIIDVGANIGDSLMVLQHYTSKKIHLYEISPKNFKLLKKYIKNNKIKQNKYTLHMIGLINFKGNITLTDGGGVGVGIGKFRNKKNEISVAVNTLDNEYENSSIDIGFIKADIEGQGYNFIQGSKSIIKLKRPVICIAIYHNYDEYFKTRYLLESIVENYIFEYHQHNNCEPFSCELAIFAYPAELK